MVPAPQRRHGRTPRLRGVVLASLLGAAAHAAAVPAVDPSRLPPAAKGAVDFAHDVRPILEAHCHSCHGPSKQKGGLRLDLRAEAFRGGEELGPAVRPGDAASSPLLVLAAGLVPDKRMPAKGDPLTPEQLGVLRAWLEQGAAWPADAPAPDPVASHWAFRPVKRPAVPSPAVPAGAVVRNPVDSFVVARLAAEGLEPSPEADRTTLVRRLYLVMLGMPPTPEEVEAFVSDPDPAAYERLVDRVLEDPRYGERWARHWLDVVRFAESNGFETNRERPNMWRYRDYVIGALNGDLPYDRFVREQVAGDALGSDVATGFLVGGPVDIVKSPDPGLTAQQRADELDDMVNTTGTAFLGLTLGCARCHSHKFDPVAQREYYALSAVFAGVQHGERALPMPARQAEALAEAEALVRERTAQLERFLVRPEPAGAGELAPVDPRRNEDVFPAVEARRLRFTIRATAGGGEPCIDELEAWAGDRNVALASAGTRATASGTLPGYEIHRLEHLNDGRTGNARSWISNEAGRGWVQLEFARPERVGRVVWGRDREGQFADRLATDYAIEVAGDDGVWRKVSGSERRRPYGGQKEAAPSYRFEGVAASEAEQGRRWLAELEQARRRRAELAKPPMAYAGTFGKPGPTFRLHRGDPLQPRERVEPATLQLFEPVVLAADAPERDRRLALADWIASPRNPLTARVLVNRVWQHHFGVGLVDTPNDFGRNGSRPSHPELLDWLADEFVHPAASGGRAWSVKRLHRLLLTSATWRQSGVPRAAAMRKDAGNRLLWRFTPRRLEAEAIRDGILAVAGGLDRTAGGPGFFLHDVDRENVYHYHPKQDFGPAESRRMVYAFKVRMEQDGIFGSFDCPDGSLVAPRRNVSTTPLQALNLFNSRFVLRQSEAFADRLRHEAGGDARAQVRRAWRLVFGREPSPAERDDAVSLVSAEGLPALCRALLNSNEFLFIP